MKYPIFIFLLVFSITLYSQDSTIDWKSDYEFLKEELPKNHYDFNNLENHRNFNTEIDKIAEQTNVLSDFEIAIKLQQTVAKLGDSHTNINFGKYFDKDEVLPLHLFWFKDGIFILHTTEENKEILGQKIVKLNGIDIETVVDSLSSILTLDNETAKKSKVPNFIPLVQLLKYFRLTDKSDIELQLVNQNGETSVHTIRPAYMDRRNRVTFKPDSLALCYKNERAPFIDYEIKEHNLIYFQYNKCWSRETPPSGFMGDLSRLPSFTDFQDKLFEKIMNDSIEKLVIDLRFNTGGNSTQGTEFVKKLSTIEKINQNGKLFVVLGRFTFSSAILNAMDLKEMTHAIFVGEETEGKPNHYGEVRSFTLPSSGLQVFYSTKYFQRVNDEINTLTPDYKIETTFNDFKNGVDPVYDWIIGQ